MNMAWGVGGRVDATTGPLAEELLSTGPRYYWLGTICWGRSLLTVPSTGGGISLGNPGLAAALFSALSSRVRRGRGVCGGGGARLDCV